MRQDAQDAENKNLSLHGSTQIIRWLRKDVPGSVGRGRRAPRSPRENQKKKLL